MGLFIAFLLTACLVVLHARPADSVQGAASLAHSHPGHPVGRLNVLEDRVLSTDTEMEDSAKIMSKKKRSAPSAPSISKCLGLPAWIAKSLLKIFGSKMNQGVPARFFLTTRSHRARWEIPSGVNFTASSMEGFDASHRTVVIVHGFMRSAQQDWIHDMTDALLDKADVNVISVHWENAEGLLKYWKTISNIQNVANTVIRFMEQLIDKVGLRTDDVHLVGHSLGAHICGFVARYFRNVSRITGLDPIQPCLKEPSSIMDTADANFVDVIHTNGRMLKKLGIILPCKMGHVDFFPKGGVLLDECQQEKRTSWTSRVWRLLHRTSYRLYQKLSESVCSHGRAYELFTESIRKPTSCVFWGHPWHMSNETEETVFERPCDLSHCSEMGYNSDLYPARGGFYVKATQTPPYCVPDQQTDAEMMAAGVAN